MRVRASFRISHSEQRSLHQGFETELRHERARVVKCQTYVSAELHTLLLSRTFFSCRLRDGDALGRRFVFAAKAARPSGDAGVPMRATCSNKRDAVKADLPVPAVQPCTSNFVRPALLYNATASKRNRYSVANHGSLCKRL